MGYRRPHYRKDHIRRNADGSKSYVRDTYVKGHTYNSNNTSYPSRPVYSSSSGSIKDALVGFFALAAVSCFITMWLGMILGWEDVGGSIIGLLVSIVLCVLFSLT